MPTGVKLLTDGSSGAPQLYATAQSLVTVLDYVLVTQAGWERVYTDAATTRVYRARTGVRHYLRVQDGVVTGSITVANMSGFEAMTGISTGTNEYIGAHSSAAGHYQGSNGTGPHPWIAVVDDRTVTFLHKITGGSIYGYELLHFGDQRRRNESDPHRTILCAKSQSFIQWSSALNAAGSGGGAGWITPRNAPGTFGRWKTGNQPTGAT